MTRIRRSHVLVTGGTQGIGLATARACARRGARVSLIGRDLPRLRDAQRQVGHGATIAAADVTDAAALRAAIAGLVEVHGRATC